MNLIGKFVIASYELIHDRWIFVIRVNNVNEEGITGSYFSVSYGGDRWISLPYTFPWEPNMTLETV